MDVISSVQACLEKWSTGGESECRAIVASPHCNPADTNCADVLSTAYQTLIYSTLTSHSPLFSLNTSSLVNFVETVLKELPSSASSVKSYNAILFGELLVDLIWAIDSELEEVLIDLKAIISSGNNPTSTNDSVKQEAIAKAIKTRELVDKDRSTLSEILRGLVLANVLDLKTCRERLENALLAGAGFLPDKVIFDKKEIRARTALFYKQNKFNLLREQSEGYSKLTADLVASLGPSHATTTGKPVESVDSLQARARSAWERVVVLIGYFDLDPNRALDIILDIFSTNIVTHHEFFLALLSYSPWSGDYQRQEQRHPEDDMVVDERVYDYQGKGFDEILRMYEATQPISTAESCDSLKPKVIQQLLGFKYKHYQSLEVQEQCPKSLYFTTALLIREGFVALEDIYPHLYPEDDAMPALHKKYLDSVQTRVSASANTLLAMAAPLESGPSSKTKATATSTEAKKPVEPTKEVHNQKALLVMALLSVGALRPALAVLSKFPWLVDLHLEIADMMIQTMKASLEPVYRAQCKPKEFDTSFSQPRARYTTGGLVSLPPRKSQLTLCNPTPPCTYTTDFVYFYPRWVERVPLCRSQEDVECVLEPFLRFVGLHIHRSPLFLGKLLRVAKSYVSSTIPASEDDTKTILISELDRPTQRFWLQIIRRYIFPALSMLPGNAVSVVDVWNLLKLFDPAVRWRLYGEWRDVTYGTHPELKVQKVLRERETKGILRRLSSDTIDALSGTLAKLTHSNPCIFFTHAVNQIQAYENLADVVILALRYTTHMSMDILVFIILDALANPSKDRVKDDGVYTSDWLQSLSTFTGSFCRRYSGDLPSVLQYIVHQLYNGQTSEIVVLEKLILKMAGIEPLPSLSDTQIAAMAGGPTLRTEALASDLRGAAFNWETATYRSTVRLGKALIETKLAFPLLAQVAQQRQACVFKAKDAHLKSIAFLFDATHGVLFQYLELLTTTSAISLEDYRAIIPPLKDMVQTYGVPLPIAMHVLRPIFNVAIAVRAKQWHSEKAAVKAETSEAAEKRLKAALAAKREPSAPANGSAEGTANGLSATVESTNGTPTINGQMDLDDSKSAAEKDSHMDSISEIPWIPELYELFEDFKAVAPGNVFDVLGPGFYLSFWQMSNYDLYYPKSRYEEMDKALHSASEALYQKFKSADRSPDRSIRKMALNHKNQRQRYLDVIAELSKEKQTQDLVYKFTNDEGGRFDREKAHWFAHANRINRVLTIVSSLIEHCIQPRCLLSPMDADFCSRFVKMLHLRGTPGFPTLMLYDRILSEQVKVVVFSCSENEARNYGRFLRGVLSDLSQWYMSEKAYDAGQRHKSGSKTLISPGFCKRWIKEGTPTQEDLLSYGDFKFFVRKCHRKLGRSLTESIEAREFMHVYNAIIVLKEIIQVFPDGAINDVTGPSLNNTIQALVQTEERGDLKILARAYASSLKKRESTWLGPRTARSASKAPTTTSSTSTTASHGPHTGTSNQEANTQGISRPDKVHNIPSGPRASLPGAGDGHGLAASDRSMSTRRALENIPRPEVVKRVRTGSKPPDDASARLEVPDRNANALSTTKDLDPKDGKAKPTAIPSTDKPPPGQNAQRASSGHTSAAELRRNDLGTVPNRLRSPPQATASHPSKDTQPHLRPPDSNDVMPPPSAPSQTASAHEIRTTARQAGQSQEAKLQAAAVAEERRSPQASSPAISRPPSPGSRPGTRNASVDSRTSGPSNRKSDRDVDSQEEKKPSRSEKSERSGGHRDVLHGRSERNGRDRSSAKESSRANDRDKSDRDRDKTRDREKDRDREHRDRDRESRDKGRARERERDRDKDRDRDRDRDRGDRHRRDSTRDDKDRDREQRPERNSVSRAQPAPGDEAAGPTLPNRPEAPKHRAPDHSGGDELGGKRRRTAEEDADRGSKRSSRRDEHREDRSRRHADKEGREHGKEDRRRKEREDEAEPKSAHEKTSDRSIARSVAPPPSAPRAMASTQSPRTTRNEALGHREREWTTAREARESTAQSPINGHSPSLPAPPVSLRARIGEKEFPLPHSTMNPTGSQRQGFDRRQGFGEDSQSDSKKRTMSDRDKDRDRDSANANGDSNMQPPKRPRINRNRYAEGSGFARRVLPIDPQAGDRSDHP